MTDEHTDATHQLNPNSALYWYPRINSVEYDLSVSVPETRFVEYDFLESIGLIDGEVPDALPWGEFVSKAREVGWPAFVRTDQKSVKHAGPGGYRAEEADDLLTIMAVLTDHHVKENRHPAALMLREFIDINAQFRAFDGLPIGRELRVFATGEDVLCDHFYWPEEAIKDGRGTPTTMNGETELDADEWRQKLDILAHIQDKGHLHTAATDAALALNTAGAVDKGTAWSVDFAQDVDGQWWLIDAALAEDSWHPDCERQEEIAHD